MAESALTPEEYELHLRDLRDRLRAFLERGEGSLRQLRKEAEEILLLADEFPQVYERYRDVEGLAADMLARQEQQRFVASGSQSEAPGCLLGWFLKRKTD